MHDNLDFNIQINDDVVIGDKQQLIAAKNYDNDSTAITIPNSSRSNNYINGGNQQLRSQDSIPVSTSAYDLSKSGHPIACIFTFLFKLLGFIVKLKINAYQNIIINNRYFFFSLKFNNTIFIFVLVITFNALDFWTVKNVTGRLLVGMRWWSSQNEQGIEEYKYETYGPEYTPNQVDYAFFWSSQLIFFILWVLIALIHVLTPFWNLRYS